jgi:site-specific DNA-methyltransferase (adenine-specific)
MYGHERKIVGERIKLGDKKHYTQNPRDDNQIFVTSEHQSPITAPSHPLAKQWSGYGSALKPSHEPIGLFRKPLDEATIAANVLKWSTGAININGCRIPTNQNDPNIRDNASHGGDATKFSGRTYNNGEPGGEVGRGPQLQNARFPSNLIHDGSEAVLAEFAKAGVTKSGAMKKEVPAYEGESTTGFLRGRSGPSNQHGDSGSVSRFFKSCQFTEEDIPAFMYYAKASRSEREAGLDGMPEREKKTLNDYVSPSEGRTAPKNGSPSKNFHPTVKPLSLMRYLCRLICPPNGIILDPFAGSGTTCLAATLEGFGYVGIEKEVEYVEIARRRVAAVPARLDRWAMGEGER